VSIPNARRRGWTAARQRRAIAALAILLLALTLWQSRRPTYTVITRVNPQDGAVMVWVPAGAFIRGETLGERLRLGYASRGWRGLLFAVRRAWEPGNNTPARRIALDGYWIYRDEVTVAQYRACCTATGRAMPPMPRWGWHEEHPIVNVTWADAAAYAAWAGAALPTEAQWEKAARGADGRIYPWGNRWDREKCNGYADSNPAGGGSLHTRTAPVGSYPAGDSPYGARDMAGNVWEWCADRYDATSYATAPARNPRGPATGAYRVLRGGDWHDAYPYNFRASYRLNGDPSVMSEGVGFRPVVTIHAPHP